MFKSSASRMAPPANSSKAIDLVVVLAAGLFFANTVFGGEAKQEPILAYAVELSACGTACAAPAD